MDCAADRPDLIVRATNRITRQAFIEHPDGRGFFGTITNAFDVNGEATNDMDEAEAVVIHVQIDGKNWWIAYAFHEDDNVKPGEIN